MAVKEWFRKLQPAQLYIVLFFTSAYFIVEIVASHVTHSQTLLLNAYHMFCNIVALSGCIASVKYAVRENKRNRGTTEDSVVYINEEKGSAVSLSDKTQRSDQSDRRMKNTFGWARIDVMTMLVCCVFLASFCFSVIVEGLQTLIHIDHLDEMHHPLIVLCIGAAGLLLNAFCYILIGGFTFNQGVYLHVTKDGNFILRRNVSSQGPNDAKQTSRSPLALPKSQGLREMFRDVLGCLLVMYVSIIVYLTDSSVAKFVDPVFAIFSAITLFTLSYPYMKESCLILLQTMPNHINIDSLKKDLLDAFPGIVNVHDLHVWQLTGEKVISTAHITFLNQNVYKNITDQVTAFFIEMGITQVTIQPEFHTMREKLDRSECLIRCKSKFCDMSKCCLKDDDLNDEYERTKKAEENTSEAVEESSESYQNNDEVPASSCSSKEDNSSCTYKIEVMVNEQKD